MHLDGGACLIICHLMKEVSDRRSLSKTLESHRRSVICEKRRGKKGLMVKIKVNRDKTTDVVLMNEPISAKTKMREMALFLVSTSARRPDLQSQRPKTVAHK